MNKKTTLNLDSLTLFKNKSSFKTFQIIGTFLLLFGIFISGCKKDDYTGEVIGLCPTVTTNPTDKAVDIAVNNLVTATFNTAMNAASISKTTFLINDGTTNISGTVLPTANNAVFTFKPDVNLDPFKTYTGTITTGARDTLRTALQNNFVWTFTTTPRISITGSPANGGTFTGAGDFNQGSNVTVNATPSTGFIFKNWTNANNSIASTNASYQFKMDGNRTLTANFIPVAAGKFAVVLSSNPIAGGSTNGTGAYDPNTPATITAIPSAGYSFTGWSGDATSAVNPLTINVNSNKNIVANFTLTPAGNGVGPGLVQLGYAGTFTSLSKSGISAVPSAKIVGNIGVSPITGTAIVGLNCADVSGSIFTVDAAGPPCRVIDPIFLTTAVSDMETAYNTAMGLVTPAPVTELSAGLLGNGQTLAPGLYKWSTNVSITGELKLNGNANDTWVFQIDQNLIANNAAKITLGPNVQAKNIFWVVKTSALLGTTVDFSGIILSKTLISVNTGTQVKGRLLAQTAITLQAGTTITNP